MTSWREPKPLLSLLTIVGTAVLIYTGTLPEFVQGGMLIGGIMGFMMHHYDQRQPSREDFVEMMREIVQEDIAENFEIYLGFMNDEDKEEES